MTLSETAGRTATVTAALVAPFAVAWYAVWIDGRAEYVHVPPAPVSTVAIGVNDGLAERLREHRATGRRCPSATEPESATAWPYVVSTPGG